MKPILKFLAVLAFAPLLASAQTPSSTNTVLTVLKSTGAIQNLTNFFSGNTNAIVNAIAPYFASSAAGTGIGTLNGLGGASQTLTVGTSGTDFGISSVSSIHTFNLPTASGSARGALSSADWTTFNGKVGSSRQVIAGSGLSGGGALSADVTLSLTSSSSGIASALSDETGSGSLVFGTSPSITSATLTTPTVSGAITFPAGTRQTFAPNSTAPGFNVGSVSADPSSLSNGDLWLQSTTGRLRARVGGASVDVATGAQQDFELGTVTSGSSIAFDLNGNQTQTLTLSTDATTLTTSNRSASKGRAITVFVTASGAQRTLTLNGSWKNYGSSSSVVIPSGKEATLYLFALGSNETDVRVDYKIQP